MASLELMLKEVHTQNKCSTEMRHPGRLYTGHGPHVEDGEAKLVAYIEHRNKREGQVLEVLGTGDTDDTSRAASSAASGAAVDAAAVATAKVAGGVAAGVTAGSTADSAWLTSLQVTRKVYPDLDFKLFFAAHSNVVNHLLKLEREGRVERSKLLGMWSLKVPVIYGSS
mmetsp:Transcript_97774/g.279630  ORF Transcript_97774/g.279630 Transcript_97774/m.279630 type:complete len:169 (+) Transcript_97774:46-552(+)